MTPESAHPTGAAPRPAALTALLDVNFLVALFDPEHVHHESAHAWLAANRELPWASCPLTENGLVRILSNPDYPGRHTTLADAAHRLREFQASGEHVFWADTVSVCDEAVIDVRHLRGHRQVTDVYLLALAVANGGRLATFDRTIAIAAVPAATVRSIAVIG